jgi:hypothetical protein
MQTWIQSRKSGEYYDFPRDAWVRKKKEAAPFKDLADALLICLRKGLLNVQLVMSSEKSGSEVFIPFA